MRSFTRTTHPTLFLRTSILLVCTAFFFPQLWGCSGEETGAGPQLIPSSGEEPDPQTTVEDEFSVKLTKWYGGHTAAISLTYDHGVRWLSEEERLIQNIVLEENVPMDFDFTNSDQDEWTARREYYRDVLIPAGIRMFGHGYEHCNSDTLSEDAALENFRRCYEDMVASGARPVAYAYPGGYCWAQSTRQALAASGFLSGRRFNAQDHGDPFICPDEELVPDDWYNLPSLVMFSYEFANDPRTIHNTEDLLPFLDEALNRTAWLITTYHEIKDGPGGTYGVQDFREDIRAIRQRDFWFASFSDVTLYLRERAAATVRVLPDSPAGTSSIRLLLSDGLSDNIYDHPLTVLLTVPEYWKGERAAIIQDGVQIATVIIDSEELLLSLRPNEHPYTLQLL